MSPKKKVVGVHIGGKGITCAAFDLNTKSIINGSQVEGRVNKDGKDRHILSLWSSQIRKSISAINIDELAGIGFSIPGPFDYQNGVADFGTVQKYQELQGLDITEELSKRLMLEIDVEFRYINDAIAFGIGEAWAEQSSVSKRLSITIGEGIGSSFISNDIPVLSGDGVPSGGVVYNRPFKGAIAEEILTLNGLLRKFDEESKLMFNNMDSLILNAKMTDAGKKILAKFGVDLGEFLSPITNDFKPQRISFGGGIGSELDLFKEGLESKLPNIELYAPREGDQLFLYGAARLFDPAYWMKISPLIPKMH